MRWMLCWMVCYEDVHCIHRRVGSSVLDGVFGILYYRRMKMKKGLLIGGILGVAILAGGGTVAYVALNSSKEEPLVAEERNYQSSGRLAYDALANALLSYDAEALDSVVGTTDGDSWLAQEWAYVNKVGIREEFLQRVGSLVSFAYPQVQQMSTTGVAMTDESGAPLMVESLMDNGEMVKITVPDWELVKTGMEENQSLIVQLYKSYQVTAVNDYTFHDDMFNLMLQYILDNESGIPTKTIELALPIGQGADGSKVILDDALLDDALFGSPEFRLMCERFGQLAVGWTGKKDEYYTVQEEQHNPEFDEWFEKFIVLYEKDGGSYDPETHKFSGGRFNPRKSGWEPWYLYDDNNQLILDEDGKRIEAYYSIKAEDGTDWIQPDEVIVVDVEKVRQVDDPWVDESYVPYNCIGTHYMAEEYKGDGLTVTRVGDGSVDSPAGIGTTIITKVLDSEGTYRDVKVALVGYWVYEEAITYAERFSTRNRGFSKDSPVKLICYEATVENLEDEGFMFDSEMTLADRNENISSKTGTLYEFLNSEVYVGPGETVLINDWANSLEMAQKYVCWGRSFSRKYPLVYFDALAGTGVVPKYSAYEQFVGSVEE